MMGRSETRLAALALGAAAILSVVPASAQTAPLAGEIRFSWWGGQSRNEKTDRILKLFEAKNPGVKVLRENADFQPHWDKLTIQAAAGNQPCTIQMQTRWLATYAKPQILRPLDDLVKSGALDTKGIAEAVMNSSRGDDGNLYMIPSGVFYFALMYNKTMADKAGMPPPANWTWQQFADYLEKLAPKLPKGVNATHNMGRETDAFVTWVQSQGEKLFEGKKVTMTTKTVTGWFDYWENLRKKKLTDSAEGMVADNGSLIEESNVANGRTFLTNRPPNRLDSHQAVINSVRPGEQLDIVQYPRNENGTTGMDLGANGIAIGANCPANLIPASVAWINFFTQDPQAAEIYASDNGVVAIDSLAKAQSGPSATPGNRRLIELFMQVAPEAKPVSWPAGGYGAVTELLARAYDAVAFGMMKPEQAADQFLKELQRAIAK